MKRPHIQFTVDGSFKDEAVAYARARGFETDSALARFALVAYMRKNPIAKTTGRTISPEDTE
jgi:hypothetical protein